MVAPIYDPNRDPTEDPIVWAVRDDPREAARGNQCFQTMQTSQVSTGRGERGPNHRRGGLAAASPTDIARL